MPLTITPGQLSRRSEFYHQLAQLTTAGIGLIAALQQLQRHPPERSFRAPIQRTLTELAQGSTFTEALERTGDWLPAFDTALIHAGEQSGRLDQCFRLLADHYNDRARMAKEIISQLIYPAFLLHFAVFIFSIVLPFAASQFHASIPWLFFRALLILSPIYLGTALVIYAGQSKHGENWRTWLESILAPIPLLGTARKYLALARLTAALEALLSAGVNIIPAWELAATASGSPAFRKTVLAWRPQLDAGRTPAELVTESPAFPHFFITQYHTGEISGKLDETLKRMHVYFQEEGTRKLRTVAQMLPRMIYLGVMLVIAYKILSFYSHMYGTGSDLDKILNEKF